MATDLVLADIGQRDAVGPGKFFLGHAEVVTQHPDEAAHMGAFEGGDTDVEIFGIIRISGDRDHSLFVLRHCSSLLKSILLQRHELHRRL